MAAADTLDVLTGECTEEEFVQGYQALIDTGQAFRLEGHVGRTAMDLIESGECMLPEVGYDDYWGNPIPSRFEVVDGSKGSPGFHRERHATVDLLDEEVAP